MATKFAGQTTVPYGCWGFMDASSFRSFLWFEKSIICYSPKRFFFALLEDQTPTDPVRARR
jgi:hypothetical protein